MGCFKVQRQQEDINQSSLSNAVQQKHLAQEPAQPTLSAIALSEIVEETLSIPNSSREISLTGNPTGDCHQISARNPRSMKPEWRCNSAHQVGQIKPEGGYT